MVNFNSKLVAPMVPNWTNVIIKEAGSSWMFDQSVAAITVAYGTPNVSVLATDDVGKVVLKPFTDGFDGTFHANVGTLSATDVWNANVTIQGDTNRISLDLVNDFNLTSWGGVESVDIEASWNSQFNFYGTVDEVTLETVDHSTLLIGVLEDDLDISESTGVGVTVYNGHNADIEISQSSDVSFEGFSMQGAHIGIFDSANTDVEVHYGDVYYLDSGKNTTIKDGLGDSTLDLRGSGTVLANGGYGDDTFYVGHDGTAILAGGAGSDTFIFETPGQTNTTILDFDTSEGDVGLIWLGNTAIDLGSFMDTFGSDNGDGSSTANIGSGSITTFEPTMYDWDVLKG